MCVCVCVCACVRASVCVVCVCVCALKSHSTSKTTQPTPLLINDLNTSFKLNKNTVALLLRHSREKIALLLKYLREKPMQSQMQLFSSHFHVQNKKTILLHLHLQILFSSYWSQTLLSL